MTLFRSRQLRLARDGDRPDERGALLHKLDGARADYAATLGRSEHTAGDDLATLGEMALALIVHASAGKATIERHVAQMTHLMGALDWGREARFDAALYADTLRFLADDCDSPADYLAAIPESAAVERTLRPEALAVLNAEIAARRA